MRDERSGLWRKGDKSFPTHVEFDEETKIAYIQKAHATKGQVKDSGLKTMLSFKVDFSKVPLRTVWLGFIEFWVIRWFRTGSKISDMTIEEAVEKYHGQELDAMSFEPEGRAKLTDAEKVDRLLDRMSKEELESLHSRLTKLRKKAG